MKAISNRTPLINNFEFSWANLQILIGNSLIPVVNVTSINYSEKQTMTNLYGIGNQPVSRTATNIEYEASINLRKSEVIAIQNAARLAVPANTTSYGSITDILPFTLVVQYQRDDYSQITIDTLYNVQFTANSSDISQGDTSVDIELPLILSHIGWGI